MTTAQVPFSQKLPDAMAAQTRRLRLTARCLGLQPVFIDDGLSLGVELFDAAGELVERWEWK